MRTIPLRVDILNNKSVIIDIKFVVFPNYINGLSGTIVDN